MDSDKNRPSPTKSILEGVGSAVRWAINHISNKLLILQDGVKDAFLIFCDRIIYLIIAVAHLPWVSKPAHFTPPKETLDEPAVSPVGAPPSSRPPALNRNAPPQEPLKVFVSYMRKDELHKRDLLDHIWVLVRRRLISDPWNDSHIAAGEHSQDEIERKLDDADVVLLLISADYIHSDNCWWELETVLALRTSRSCIVIPIYVRECHVEGLPFTGLSWLPDAKHLVARTPVTSSRWGTIDEAWTNVANGIGKAVELELARRR